jgi:hypothetical protein
MSEAPPKERKPRVVTWTPGPKKGAVYEQKHDLTCLQCGRGFKSARIDAKYCKNTSCGAKYRRQRGGRS